MGEHVEGGGGVEEGHGCCLSVRLSTRLTKAFGIIWGGGGDTEKDESVDRDILMNATTGPLRTPKGSPSSAL